MSFGKAALLILLTPFLLIAGWLLFIVLALIGAISLT